MKRCTWLVCVLGVLAWAVAPALAQEAASGDAAPKKKVRKPKAVRKAKAPPSAIRGSYAVMAREGGLDDQQKAELEKILKTYDEEMERVRHERDEKIAALVTAEQKQKYEGFQLCQSALGRYRKVNLTEDQKTAVRLLADETVKSLVAAEAAVAGATDNKEKSRLRMEAIKIRLAFGKRVREEVLTEAQREQTAPKSGKPKAAKPKPNKKKAPATPSAPAAPAS